MISWHTASGEGSQFDMWAPQTKIRNHFLFAVAICSALVGCGASDDAIRDLQSCEQQLGELIAVADKIEFVDDRLIITRLVVDEQERAEIKGKSLLFSKSQFVKVNVGMLLSIPAIPTGFAVSVYVRKRDTFVVDVDSSGAFSEPRTEAATSLELAPP
ncbi:hypothetical protein [Lacipirellula parvula]|uniref:Uncharacterized protein n=1 Tax=Lacipirellula parvula TaxID=2650471 RepID=A0A5K7XHV2_9BACT|nr:hypothetical protein [Lacipirellula parvula]BBO36460.1 hypothetical protein PLANPX_6072 [Lacipirellula parvula]